MIDSSSQSTSARDRIADFWDKALADWIDGKPQNHPDLVRWQASYGGKGIGKVDLEHYPDPIVGDIRGINTEPRVIILGLNPGIGYDSLQSHDGIWAKRIKEQGYSYCLNRSPAADPASWIALHCKESPYWRNAITFTQRWLNDPSATINDILNFELYPWHSRGINGKMQPPTDLLQHYVWDVIREFDIQEVFAFGKEWFKVVNDLGLQQIALYGPGGNPLPDGVDMEHWRLGFYRLSPRQVIVVSSQRGYSGPPSTNRLNILRTLLTEVIS